MQHKRKLNVGSVIGSIVLGGLMIALLIYTATRTVHFLQMTFPPSMSYVAYLALAAFDGGILGWTIFATSAAEGALQRGVAYLMIFVCTLGVILTTIADTTTVSAQNGMTKLDPYMATVGMWGSIAIIVLNVVAIIVTHLVSPHHVRKFELENVHDSIHQLTMQHIRDRAITIAPQIAAEHADHWVRTTIQDVVGSLPASKQMQQIPARVIDADPSRQLAAPASAAHQDQVLDPYQVKPKVDAEKKDLSEKKGLRSWVDEKLFKVEEDGQNGESVSPVNDDKALEDAFKAGQRYESDIRSVGKYAYQKTNAPHFEKWKEQRKSQEVQYDNPGYDEYDPDEDVEEEVVERSPKEWTLEEWQILRDKIDAFAFDDLWKLYKGDTSQPWDKTAVRKKGKKSKALQDSQADQ